MNYCLNFDGGGLSAGGPGGWGAVLATDDGEIVEEQMGYLANATNNEAEYAALIYGLMMAAKYRPSHLHVRGDSQLVIMQCSPHPDLPGRYRYKTKGPELRRLQAHATRLLRRFPSYELQWGKRTLNKRADALATQARKEGMARITPIPF